MVRAIRSTFCAFVCKAETKWEANGKVSLKRKLASH
jgi:hypothetical protein